MCKTKKLEILFDEWQNKIAEKFGIEDNFYKDGIVNECIWSKKERIHPLFILKEVHECDKPCICNFLESSDIKNGYIEHSTTWRNLMCWASQICNKNYSFDDMKQPDKYTDILNEVSIMNLKKCSGGKHVNSDDSKKTYTYIEHTEEFGEYIKHQIKIISPDIIVACSREVFRLLYTMVFPEIQKPFKGIDFPYNYGKYFDISSLINVDKPVYVVEYRHPSQCTRWTSMAEHCENMLKIRKYLLEK